MPDLDPQAYREAFRETKNPAILTDRNLIIQDANDAAVKMTGYDRDELIGMHPQNLINSHDTDVMDEIADTLFDGEPWFGDFKITTKNNRTVDGRGTATPVTIEGDVVGYAGIWVDMTERLRYEHTLKILNRVLRHNLKNDANVILGYIDSVRTELDDDQHEEFLSKAKDKIKDVLGQADTARDLEALLTDEAGDSNEPIRIDSILETTVANQEPQYPKSDIEFDHDDEKAVYVSADDTIHKIFEALIENAVQHNDKEEAEVALRIEERENVVQIHVEDNGPGIPEEQRDRVFGREEKSQLQHGQGLSLFFVDQVVAKYNGQIWIEDNEPDGAVFVVELLKPDEGWAAGSEAVEDATADSELL